MNIRKKKKEGEKMIKKKTKKELEQIVIEQEQILEDVQKAIDAHRDVIYWDERIDNDLNKYWCNHKDYANQINRKLKKFVP